MNVKTYFTELIIVSALALSLLGATIYLGISNNQLKAEQTEQASKTPKQMEQSSTLERNTVKPFVTNYFNYSSEDYKDRLDDLKGLVSASMYQTLKLSFDDMFIEKGYKSTLESYVLYQSTTDKDHAFLTAKIIYEMNGDKQESEQTAYLTFETANEKQVISEIKFVQRSEY